jgi:folate-binding protein YgfZ
MSSLQHTEHRAAPHAGLGQDGFAAKLDHLGLLQFSGQDAESFLQGQLSCDVSQASTYGAYCTPQGRMLASFFMWRAAGGFSMMLSRDLAALVHKQISKYVLRSKIKVADASESHLIVGSAGVQAGRALADSRENPIELKDGRMVLALPAAAASEMLRGLEFSDPARWRWLDIRGGLPLITAATQGQFIPQMANLELIGGVSFDKGCYTGQEVVARAQHLGRVRRRMYLANVSAPAEAGDPLYSDDLAGQTSGTVLNAEPSPDGGHDLLAVMQSESRERSNVHLKAPDGPVLRFLPLPYTVP